MGVRTPETCWAVNKRQVINWRDCCIWLVNLFELHFSLTHRRDQERKSDVTISLTVNIMNFRSSEKWAWYNRCHGWAENDILLAYLEAAESTGTVRIYFSLTFILIRLVSRSTRNQHPNKLISSSKTHVHFTLSRPFETIFSFVKT
jgi:hypothetical protein